MATSGLPGLRTTKQQADRAPSHGAPREGRVCLRHKRKKTQRLCVCVSRDRELDPRAVELPGAGIRAGARKPPLHCNCSPACLPAGSPLALDGGDGCRQGMGYGVCRGKRGAGRQAGWVRGRTDGARRGQPAVPHTYIHTYIHTRHDPSVVRIHNEKELVCWFACAPSSDPRVGPCLEAGRKRQRQAGRQAGRQAMEAAQCGGLGGRLAMPCCLTPRLLQLRHRGAWSRLSSITSSISLAE
ncbi:hypothetical protein BT67DRAFT_246751 [Trichocladium antarcticum]|uniref:Uncharacterized protein n=1 Tax=Trichocladium antarcticum TaxID=1450529 RepID=A0AAN6Z9R4_9PEZI|nr:hypothetical protein BT67DRAFT_246751 [Trichocladium antarcticum]